MCNKTHTKFNFNNVHNIEWIKCLWENAGFEHDPECKETIRIVFHKEEEFAYIGENLQKFSIENLEYNSDELPSPILHLSVIRHLNLQDKALDKDGDKKEWQKYHRKYKHRHQYVMDSSIWNYYYSYEQHLAEHEKYDALTDEGKSCFEFTIDRILREIAENYNNGLYSLSSAIEYADFQKKQVSISKLANVDGGHAMGVSPFLFHSEQAMKSRIDFLTEYRPYLCNANWRFLLVDDHATGDDNGGMRPIGKGKSEIIMNVIKQYLGETYNITVRRFTDPKQSPKPYHPQTENCQTDKTVRPEIVIDSVASVDKAEQVLEAGWRYDIILLDYKLFSDNDSKREYGYKLLRDIDDKFDERKNKTPDQRKEISKKEKPGPNGMFYFMFISAYTTAIHDRMRMEGFRTKTDYWFIDRGACPTNTPYLFLYSLKRMIDNRYEMLTAHGKQLIDEIELNKGLVRGESGWTKKDQCITVAQFLSILFKHGEERNRCVRGFNAFLNLRRVYNKVKYDVYIEKTDEDKSSPLIMSLFKDLDVCTNSFWEHLQNLVYMTAFGTIRQWPEMWEDYMFVKNKLEEAEKKCKMQDSEDRPSVLIRNYILSLKRSIG